MKKVITHSGSFHSDDVFAVATLQLVFGIENIEVVRTRDEEIINSGDIVVDVGGVYDAGKNRYDHHQPGAPIRDNGVPYAGFGLIWRHFGEQIAGNIEVFEIIEKSLCLPIDSADNGVQIFDLNEVGASPFLLQDVVSGFKPVWGSDDDIDVGFMEAVNFARGVLERSVAYAKAKVNEINYAKELYESAEDKRVMVSEKSISPSACSDFEDVLLIVCPTEQSETGNWTATATRKEKNSFETKVLFPVEWGGLRDEELAKISGIPDAVFCHKARFLFVAGSKIGVLKAVEQTLKI